MKCPKCQTENPDSKKFCYDCGAKLLILCPQCGGELLPNAKFCGDCGAALCEPEGTSNVPISKIEFEARTNIPNTKFVGRTEETKKLKELYELARSGFGQVVELEGEAGVGKSRLLYEFRSGIPPGECTYLEGRCYHYGGSMPYLPLIDILRTYFGLTDGDGELVIKRKIRSIASGGGRTLKDPLPALEEMFALEVEDQAYLKLDSGQKRGRMFEAVGDLFIQEARKRPLVLVFEDLHWIDKSSEDFLRYVFGSLEKTSILLILPYRPPYRLPLEPKAYRTKIALEELPAESQGEFLHSILEQGEVARDVMDLILTRARGNPLFLEEITQSLLETGLIQKERHRYVLAGDLSERQPLDTLQEVIGARINRADESIRRVMQVGSVIGSKFAFRTLQSMAMMKEDLRSYLASFEELAFLQERSSFPEIEYVFKHALIQEVTYNGLLRTKRREIHKRIGTAIEALYAENLEEYYELLAYHYSNSDDLEKAFHYLKLSGDKATRKYSLWEAMHFYEEAIAILKQLPATEQNRRAELEARLSISTPMFLLSYPEGSLENLQETERLAKEMADKKALSIVYSNLTLYHTTRGQPLLGVRYAKGPFRKAEKDQDIDLMAPIACQLCAAYLHSGQHSKLVEVASEVTALLEQAHRERDFFGTRYNVYSGLCGMCVLSSGMLGHFEEKDALFEKGLCNAYEANSVYALGLMELFYGIALNVMGDGKTALGHLKKSLQHFEEAQSEMGAAHAWASLGHAYYLLDDPDSCQKWIEKALKILTEKRVYMFSSLYHLLMSMAYSMSGEVQKAEYYAYEALTIAKRYDQSDFVGTSLIWLGSTLGQTRATSVSKAEEHIVAGIKMCDDLLLKPWCAQGYLFLGELYADSGMEEEALEKLGMAETMFREMGMDYWLIRTEKVIGRR